MDGVDGDDALEWMESMAMMPLNKIEVLLKAVDHESECWNSLLTEGI